MKIAILIFLFLSAIAGIGTLVFVVVDYVIEKTKNKKEPDEEMLRQTFVPTPATPTHVITVHEAEMEIQAHIIDHIDAEKADEIISDAVAMTAVIEEKGAGVGYRTYINIGDIDKTFQANDTVTLDVLKEKGMVAKKARRIKILAGGGELTKPMTVKAESFSIEAVKMIELTGGTVVILK